MAGVCPKNGNTVCLIGNIRILVDYDRLSRTVSLSARLCLRRILEQKKAKLPRKPKVLKTKTAKNCHFRKEISRKPSHLRGRLNQEVQKRRYDSFCPVEERGSNDSVKGRSISK